MKRGTLHKMIITLWNLWTATEVKIGCLFSIAWLCFNQLVGGVDEQINALVALVACDILTGLWASFKLHAFASSIATHGLYKKAAMFLIIGLGVLLDTAMHTHMVRTLFIGASGKKCVCVTQWEGRIFQTQWFRDVIELPFETTTVTVPPNCSASLAKRFMPSSSDNSLSQSFMIINI